MLIKKIEAREACDWLRAAGFPQYVQLFREGQFPVDLDWAKQDHGFLDKDAVESLCRRLTTLNKSSELRLEPRRSKRRGVDSEEDDFCAISPNWTYDRATKHWRRIQSNTDSAENSDLSFHSSDQNHASHSSCSSDSEGLDHVSARTRTWPRFSPRTEARSLDASFSACPSPGGSSGVSLDGSLERATRKKGTSLLRKIDKLKLRRTNGGLREAKMLMTGMGRSLESPEEEDGTLQSPESPQSGPNSPPSSCPSSPQTISSHSQSESGSSDSQSESSSSAVSTPSPVTRVRSNSKRGFSSETNKNNQGTEDYQNQVNLSHTGAVFEAPLGHKPGSFPSLLPQILDHSSVNWRTGSFHGYQRRGSGRRHGTSSLAAPTTAATNHNAPRSDVMDLVSANQSAPDHRLSLYDNIQPLSESEGSTGTDHTEVFGLLGSGDVFSALDTVLERISDLQQLVSSWTEDFSEEESPGDSPAHSSPTSLDHMDHIDLDRDRQDQGEETEHVQEPEGSRVKRALSWSSESSPGPGPGLRGLQTQSWSQLAFLQKLSLLKLTALMDKHSPSSRQGWSWTVPKPQRKTKVPEVKGRRVFGVPLLVNMQQTGEPLPPGVLRALVYLRNECLQQVGVFRKSGVKSRIQTLRDQLESDPDQVSFRGQCAFDVADLVKQYFRDLPEPVFSSRLTETFLHIYQYFPQEQQLGAVQAAILLLPDENRAALRTLLHFLSALSRVEENHMTPTNIGVCLAPSLFHLSAARREGPLHRPGHRKYSLGRPDQRDLSENLAATQGLAHMISEAHRLFQLPVFWPGPIPTSCPNTDEGAWPHSPGYHGDGTEGEELHESRLKLQRNTQLLKLSRDQSQTWTSFITPDGLQLDYSKAPDLCPVPLWRASLDLDVPPPVVLQRILSERAQFDPRLHWDSRLRPLSPDSDLYQYEIQSQGHGLGSVPRTLHTLIRSWQSDPSSGPLHVSSLSIPHRDVPTSSETAQVHCCLYLLEPTGDKKTRLTHLCSTEYRGRTLQWHVKVSGHLLANELLSIRDSFKQELNQVQL